MLLELIHFAFSKSKVSTVAVFDLLRVCYVQTEAGFSFDWAINICSGCRQLFLSQLRLNLLSRASPRRSAAGWPSPTRFQTKELRSVSLKNKDAALNLKRVKGKQIV